MTKVAFGTIPVPVEETTKLLGSTSMVELLANHLVNFIQLSSFVDGLYYGFFMNVPTEDYKVLSALHLNILDKDKNRFSRLDKTKPYTDFPVLVVQDGTKLTLLPLKPLKHTSWSDIEELLQYMPLKSDYTFDEAKAKFETTFEWVFAENEKYSNSRYDVLK
jgi:hypothetical protein